MFCSSRNFRSKKVVGRNLHLPYFKQVYQVGDYFLTLVARYCSKARWGFHEFPGFDNFETNYGIGLIFKFLSGLYPSRCWILKKCFMLLSSSKGVSRTLSNNWDSAFRENSQKSLYTIILKLNTFRFNWKNAAVSKSLRGCALTYTWFFAQFGTICTA